MAELTGVVVGTSNAAAVLESHGIELDVDVLRAELKKRVGKVTQGDNLEERDSGYRLEFEADGPNFVEESDELRAYAKALAWHLVAFSEG